VQNFFKQLKERNVVKEGLAYLVVSWMVLQVSAIVLPLFSTPPWVMKTLLIILTIGFPIWMIIAWLYEITPEGLRKNENVKHGKASITKRRTRLNRIIIGALSIAVILLLADKIMHRSDVVNVNSVSSATAGAKSVAVLPFENMSSDEESQFFSDGVMEDILTHLARLEDIKVISRTSSMHYKGTTKKITEIAKELGVAYVLEGSVRQYDNKVRIVAQLIDALEDNHVWANNFDRELEISDIFTIQSEVSLLIANALEVNISPEVKSTFDESPTQNTDAYQKLLKGRSLADSRTLEGLTKSKEVLESAILLDPNYADALAELGNTTWLLGYYFNGAEEAYKKAEALANKALSINANNQRAHSVLANVYIRTNKFSEGSKAFEKALSLNPSDATTHHHYSIYFDNIGNTEKAFYHSEHAITYDPLSLIINFHYLSLLMSSNRLDDAELHLKKMEILFEDADQQFARFYGNLYLAEKKYHEAIPYFEIEMVLSRHVEGELGYCYAKIGNSEKAKEYMKKVPESIYDINAAIIYFALENPDSAYHYLNKCYDKGLHLGAIKNEPVFDEYRGESRFKELINKISANQVE
jgi:TolB-like protein/Flp pilus assembly protein TadD